MRAALCLCLSLTLSLFAEDFPKPFNTGTDVGLKPMPADEAVKLIKMPPGFRATVFAAEPDVQNPIACAWDSRGRLWVAENYTYADAKTNFDKTLRDRILIFEDTDNDGKADKRTVFAEGLQNLSSIELGYGGVYATAAPHLLFIPDRDGDDKPDAPIMESAKDAEGAKDGKPADVSAKDAKGAKNSETSPSTAKPQPFAPLAPLADKNPVRIPGTSFEVLLDGFDAWSIRHNFVNGLRWGPDGWLYGRHGIQATSRVGTPGTPDAERVAINCCIWRFHPVRRAFEIVTWGGTNPWGLDFNAEGEGFFTNTVTGHLYHVIPGAHYERMYGEDPNPHIYQLLPQTADHYHYDRSKSWTDSRDGKASDLGGGHAHSGCMIYLGENWPAEYRGKLFTLNFHGRRINVNRLERKGSGYTGKSEPDMIFFGDPWFRGIDLTYGPDGGVYVLDWSDQGECHENDGVHRESGRIYKITHGEVKKPAWLGKSASIAGPEPRAVAEKTTSQREGRASGSAGVPPAVPGVPPGTSNVESAPQREGPNANERPSTSDGPRETRGPAGGTPALPARTSNASGDLAALTDGELMAAGETGNEWTARIAMRLFAGRMAAKPLSKEESRQLTADYLAVAKPKAADNEQEKLRARRLMRLFGYKSGDKPRPPMSPEIRRMTRDMIANDSMLGEPLGATGRRWICSDMRGRPSDEVLFVMQLILSFAEDNDDGILPLLYWSTFERLFNESDETLVERARSAAFDGKIRLMHEFTARHLASDLATLPTRLDGLLALAANSFDETKAASITRGIAAALRGVSKAPAPKNWPAFAAKASAIPALTDKVRELNVIFGDGRALDEIRALALDGRADLAARRQAVETLVTSRDAELRAVCEKLVTNGDLAPGAIRGLATFDDPAAAALAVANWPRVRTEARAGVIGALCSRPVFARALLDAIGAGKIARENLTAYHARQLAALGDAEVSKRLAAVWGEVRTTPDDKKRRIAELKTALTPEAIAKADITKGRAAYTQACAACHTLFDLGQTGANLGPNLTGSGRGDLNYLLENIVDPSAIVPADYKLSTVTLKDGRVLSGFISAQNDQTLTLRTMTETQTVPRAEVAKTESTPQSLMPDGLLDTLTPEQVRDLFGFLMKK